ncbi:MAG: 16S rRNA (guanine(966)-N(2))-methyltransferase RsmD [Deferrisomatales bacterium]|nr:16S rRNA (guanine(966)-N(2))-methyltransferase RsmD [Deferrisomatales bacterium]
MGKLRITSGTLRGRSVAAPPGEGTRPLLTRVRKSLVDILRPRLPGAAVLDLFAGSGAIGFELLSNGAGRCTMVEQSREVVDLIHRSATELGVRVAVHHIDALAFLAQSLTTEDVYDVILVAPPYGLGLQQQAVDGLATSTLLAPGGLVVVQRDTSEPEWQPGAGAFERVRTRAYGRTVFEFIELRTAGDP